MTKYVAGLLFDDTRESVALIHKNHGPDAVVGKWNAIGGKVGTASAGQLESSDAAIWREFIAKAGVEVNWTPFLILTGADWQVDFFHAFSTEKLNKCETKESEEVDFFFINDLPEVVPNLRWIIPMALGHEDDHVWVYSVHETETCAPRGASQWISDLQSAQQSLVGILRP